MQDQSSWHYFLSVPGVFYGIFFVACVIATLMGITEPTVEAKAGPALYRRYVRVQIALIAIGVAACYAGIFVDVAS